MSPPRILNDKQERDVAISYLCGVNPDYIRERWGVALSTIIATILNKRSPSWNDPLLEFYKSRQRNYWNFAHFCLAYEAREGLTVEHRELIDTERDRDIYEAIMEDLIHSMEESIAGATGLKNFVQPHTGIEELLSDVFGKRTVDQVLSPIIFNKLFERYLRGKEFSLNRFIAEIKEDVVYKLKYGGLTITPLKEELFYSALVTLSSREVLVLELLYGIKRSTAFTLERTGNCLDLTRERVRQIKEKAIQRLGQGSRSKLLRALYELTLDIDALQAL